MSFSEVSFAVGWVAVALGTTAAYLQFRRVGRHGAHGVSLSTWTLFVLLAIFWMLYGLSVRSWPLLVGTVLALPWQLSILVRLRPWQRWDVVARALALVLVCSLAPALWWGWTGAVLGAGSAGTFTRVPQLAAVLRSSAVSGVSSGSWLLGVAVSSLWVVYYLGARLWAVLVVTALAGTMSLGIAVLSRRRQREAGVGLPSAAPLGP